jgi:hypothetical protein
MTTGALMDQCKNEKQEATKAIITFKELKWEHYIESDKVQPCVVYQVAKINLLNNEYEFITKIGNKFYFKDSTGNLILVNQDSQFIVYSYTNTTSFRPVTTTTGLDLIPLNLRFHYSLHSLGIKPLSEFPSFSGMSKLEQNRAVFYSDLVFACAQAGIDYKTFEKLTSFLPKVSSKAQQSQLLAKASYLIKNEDIAIRFKDRVSQHWTFLKPNVFVEFDELEYLHKQTNQWLTLTLT